MTTPSNPMALLEYQSVALFGGALTVSLPSTFTDVSQIRQVPDHQEVWIDNAGFSSVVIDILERVTVAASSSLSNPEDPDAAALKHHLHDIVASDGSSDAENTTILSIAELSFPRFPAGTKAYGLLAQVPTAEKMKGRANEPDVVGMFLMVVRLKVQGTDLVVSVNVPHVVGTQGYDGGGGLEFRAGRMGTLMEMGEKIKDKVVETLEVKEWGLFVQE